MRSLLVWACALAPLTAHAEDVGGLISENTTWTAAASPYTVVSPVIVGAGATLTIEPGVTVFFEQAQSLVVGLQAFGAGEIVAIGTAEAPITFTRADDSNSWNGISLGDLATDAVVENEEYVSGSTFQHCIISAGGAGGAWGSISADLSTPFLADCTFLWGLSSAFRVQCDPSHTLYIIDCTFQNHTAFRGGGVRIDRGDNHVLRNLQFIDNNAPVSGGGGGGFGGGLYIFDADNVLVDNVLFQGNTSDKHGGGAYITQSINAVMQDVVFIDNETGIEGGGLHAVGNFGFTIFDAEFTGNTATNEQSRGGGALIEGRIITTTFTNNTAWYGGAMRTVGEGAEIFFSEFTANSAVSRDGGAVNAESADDILAMNCIFTDNHAADDGGAVYVNLAESFTAIDCVFTGNTANDHGGAIYISSSDGFDVAGTTLTGNIAGDDGGALWTNSPNGSLAGDEKIYNTIAFNEAGRGAAVFYDVPFEQDGDGDLPAQNVCWGSSDPGDIADAIWDFFDNMTLGVVVAHPFIDCAPDCDADCDQSGALDILDFICFQQRFQNGDAEADCNNDGVLNVLDFVCFQLTFAEGC